MLFRSHAEGGMVTVSSNQITDFEVAGADKEFVTAETILKNNEIELSIEMNEIPCYVRYVHRNTPCGSLVYNKQGLPMAPFTRKLF